MSRLQWRRLLNRDTGDCPVEQFCCLRELCRAPETQDEVLPEIFACDVAEIMALAWNEHHNTNAPDGLTLRERFAKKLRWYHRRLDGLWKISPATMKRECQSEALNVLKENLTATLDGH